MKHSSFRFGARIVLCAALAVVCSSVVFAGPTGCETRVNNTIDKLLECVTLEGVRTHQAALQAIANANGGTRAAGTPGYDASLTYVAQKLAAAGYNVTLNPFPFTFLPPATLRQTAPIVATYATGSYTGTGYGTVTAAVTAVDINLVPPRANTSGCEAADFAGFPAGNIALIQRGTCTFAAKALNAQAAGASAVVIFNQGNTPEREGLIIGTLAPSSVAIPVVGASFANGVSLAQAGSQAYVRVDPPQNVTQYNVISESRDGDPNNVVIAGAHLDSVQGGPGINDNGSGVAALLETAIQMSKVKPRNKLRFAFWGGMESGFVGSTTYLNSLPQAQQDRIALYLDFHMLGSPNHVFQILNGDLAPAGSIAIEQVLATYFNQRAIPYQETPPVAASDYVPFGGAGIPFGGLFSGATGIKTAAEAAIWGGTAGVAYDPCVHLACDTFANVNLGALDVNSDAAAYAILHFAMSTQVVNGQRGKGNFNPSQAAPQATQ